MEEQVIAQATVSIDRESYKTFRKDNLGNRVLYTLVWTAFSLVVILILAVFIANLFSIGFDADLDRTFVIAFGAFAAMLAGMLMILIRVNVPARASKVYQKSKAVFGQERQYAFYENRLIAITQHCRYEVEYAHYVDARETEAAFYLKTPEGLKIILPKKCFTQEQVAALHELFARKFGGPLKGIKLWERYKGKF